MRRYAEKIIVHILIINRGTKIIVREEENGRIEMKKENKRRRKKTMKK